MELCEKENSSNSRFLRLTSCLDKETKPTSEPTMESLVLDLSSKSMILTPTELTDTINPSTPLVSPRDVDKEQRKRTKDLLHTWKNLFLDSAITSRETESLDKKKFDSIYNNNNQINGSQINSHHVNLSQSNSDRINSEQINSGQSDSTSPITHLVLPPPSYSVSIESAFPQLLTNDTAIPKIPTAPSPVTSLVTSVEMGLSVSTPDTVKKAPRPFKAYPRDPLTFTTGNEQMYDRSSNVAYVEFRKKMLEYVKKVNENTNSKMRRVSNRPGSPTSTVDEKDAAYWERRRKNNEAAKRSRDARRAKEDEIAIRAAFLERENKHLKRIIFEILKETEELNLHLKIRALRDIKDSFTSITFGI